MSSKNIKILSPGCTNKLLPKWLGPFTIIGYCGRHQTPPENGVAEVVAYKLSLPEYMRIHDVFHVSLLKPYHRDGRQQPPPLPICVEGEEWFTVEKILNHEDRDVITKRATKRAPKVNEKQRFYLVKWLGYGNEHNSWEPEHYVCELGAFRDYLAYRGISPFSKHLRSSGQDLITPVL